jgi:hypothetical protein
MVGIMTHDTCHVKPHNRQLADFCKKARPAGRLPITAERDLSASPSTFPKIRKPVEKAVIGQVSALAE